MKKLTISYESQEELDVDLEQAASQESDNGDDSVELNDELGAALEEIEEQINSEISENDKVLDIADNLYDVADAVENSGQAELNTTEKQLIASSVNMAVAGTGEDATGIAPSMEAFSDKTIMVSQLRQKHNVAIEGIVDSFQKIIEGFSDFIVRMFSFTAKIEYKLKNVKKELAGLKTAKNTKVSIQFKKSTYLKKNITEYVTDTDDYISTLKQTTAFFSKFAPLAERSISSFKGSILKYWTTLPGSEATFNAAAGLYNSYMKDYIDSTISLPGMKKVDSLLAHVDSYRSQDLLGGSFVLVNKYNKPAEASEDNIPEMKNTISNSIVFFNRWMELVKSKNSSESNKIKFDLTIKDLETIISEVEKNLATFKLFLNSSYKSFKTSSILAGPKMEWNGRLMSLHTLIVNKGINNAIVYSSYARAYSKVLCSAPLAIVEKAVSSSKWES